jgi:phosphonatase-like hydrolase
VSRLMPELVVFDLVGTTMQDDGTVAAAFLDVLRHAQVRAAPEEIARVRGASKREALERLVGDHGKAEHLFRVFVSSLRQRYAEVPPREVPGTSEVFAWLRAHRVKVALNSGFERATMDALISAIGWDPSAFDAVVCGDEVSTGRPSPAMIQEAMRRTGVAAPAAVMAVGDTVLDLQAAAAAHAGWIVGVTSGAHDRARLSGAPHTHIVGSVAEVCDLLGGH